MIQELLEKKRVLYAHGFDQWEDSIRVACTPLLNDGSITADYVQAIIDNVHEFGTYICIAPDICIPHAMAGGPGVNQSAICMMKTEVPVSFEPGNPEKDVRLFFVIAAKEPQEHLDNLVKLVDMLSDDALVQQLLSTSSLEDLAQL